MSTAATHFACDACGRRYKWKAELAGKTARCACGKPVIVPQAIAPAALPGRTPVRSTLIDPYDLVPDQDKAYAAVVSTDDLADPEAIPTAVPVASGARASRAIAYASPGACMLCDRALGDCDVAWVLCLRNAARLMVIAIVFDYLAWICLPGDDFTKGIILIVFAGLNLLASWFLTTPEPATTDAAESPFSVRMALRIAATIAGATQIVVAVGGMSDNGQVMKAGAWAYLFAGPVALFLFLFYLRRLALRLPDADLAMQCTIVMIALPSVVCATYTGSLMAARHHHFVVAILTGAAGLVALLIFRIWYICLLVWFNRSFS